MVSTSRLKYDLLVQALLLAVIIVLLLSWLPSRAVWFLCLLAGWQLLSATHLLVHFDLRSRYRYLLSGTLSLAFGLVAQQQFGLMAWSPLVLGALVYLSRTLQEYRRARRRGQSFWDLF